MCGRYELHTHPAALALAFGLSAPPEIHPHYNIAPTQQVPIVRLAAGGERELLQMRWGLVPRWAKDPSIGARMINARAETLMQRSAFRNAFQRHRCLLPADGFYEWMTRHGGKQPVLVRMKDGTPFGLAGLYERWLAPDGEVLDTCAIVTTSANALLHDLHERMPVIVPPADYARWLDAENDEVGDLFLPYPAEAMAWQPVSTRVNAVRNDDPSLIDAIVPAPVTRPASGADGTSEDAPAPTKEPVQASLL